MKKRIAIIGCGVSGLSCGISLLDAGFAVHIVARDLPPHTTSNVAAAWWFAYKAAPENKVKVWAQKTLQRLKTFYAIERAGVVPLDFTELLHAKQEVPWWGTLAEQGRFLTSGQLPSGYQHAYRGIVTLTNSQLYIPFLIETFTSKGGTIFQNTISNLDQELKDFEIIVNCTGVWAGALVDDKDIHPARGRAIRLSKPDITPRCWADAHGQQHPIFVVPRHTDYVVGTTFEEHEWTVAPDPKATQFILERVYNFEPALRDSEILEVTAGLRPVRSEVRVERESLSDGRILIHNYGHGGSGFVLSWGCAEDVVSLASDQLI